MVIIGTMNSSILRSNIGMNALDCSDLLKDEVSLIRSLFFSLSSQLLNKFHVFLVLRNAILPRPPHIIFEGDTCTSCEQGFYLRESKISSGCEK